MWYEVFSAFPETEITCVSRIRDVIRAARVYIKRDLKLEILCILLATIVFSKR